MPSEEDKKAKEASRASRSNKPGAVSVADEETARLDQRIAEKRGEESAGAVGGDQLERLQADVVAKQQAAAGSPASKPGAIALLEQDIAQLEREIAAKGSTPSKSSNGVAAGGLESLEADVVEKQRGKAAPAVAPGVVSSQEGQLSQMEQDILQKQQGKRGSPASSPGVVTAGSALSQLEQDVVAKEQSGTVARAAGPGANPAKGAQLNQLEQDIAAKSDAASTGMASGPGAHSGLSSLEDAVAAKTNSQPSPLSGGGPGLASLEDAITRKNQVDGGASSRNDLDALENSVTQKTIGGALVGGAAAPTGEYATDLSRMEADVVAKNGGTPDLDSPLIKVGDDTKDPEPEQAPPKHEDGGDVEYGVYDPEDEGGLAVALPVAEDEDDPYIQSAVEYDPDAKPPIYRRRRFRLFAFLGFFALVAAAVGAVVGVVLSGNNKNSNDAAVEVDPLRERIERLVGTEALDEPGSSYEEAYLWMKFNDTMQLEPTDANFVQRFSLVSFYYATTVDGPWRTCNPPEGDEDDGCTYQHLVSIPDNYQDMPWIRWLTGTHECEWAGIACDEESGQVRAVEFSGQGLSGEWPQSLKFLPFLQSISFPVGSLRGTIPADIVELDHLISIEVQYNELTGPVPEELFASRHLTRFNLASNRLSGTISPRIGEAQDLRALYMQDNDITGPIPTELGLMTNLAYFYANKNGLTGTIPEQVSGMSSIERFYAQKNDLNGTLPANIGNCQNLVDFRVQQQLNGNLRGSIPESLYDIKGFWRLDIRGNKFSGSLSSKIGDLHEMLELRLSGNRMTGVLPSSIATLSRLRRLDMEGPEMNITGAIPTEQCERRGVIGLTSLSANCKADATGFLEVECPAECSCSCCDPQGMDCD